MRVIELTFFTPLTPVCVVMGEIINKFSVVTSSCCKFELTGDNLYIIQNCRV